MHTNKKLVTTVTKCNGGPHSYAFVLKDIPWRLFVISPWECLSLSLSPAFSPSQTLTNTHRGTVRG